MDQNKEVIVLGNINITPLLKAQEKFNQALKIANTELDPSRRYAPRCYAPQGDRNLFSPGRPEERPQGASRRIHRNIGKVGRASGVKFCE